MALVCIAAVVGRPVEVASWEMVEVPPWRLDIREGVCWEEAEAAAALAAHLAVRPAAAARALLLLDLESPASLLGYRV